MVSFALYNLKGGVGKTASTINLAYLSAQAGYKTLIWDTDPQGSSSFYVGVEASIKNEGKKIFSGNYSLAEAAQPTAYDNLSIVPADLSLRHADVLLSEQKAGKKVIAQLLQTISKEYDVVFIDCPPGLSALHDAIFYGVHWVLMPNIPTTLSINSFETVKSYVQENGFDEAKLKCFFSMVDHRKNLHHETMNSFYKDKLFFKNYVPYLSDVERMGVQLAPVETYAYSSFAAQCYRDLWKEISKNCID